MPTIRTWLTASSMTMRSFLRRSVTALITIFQVTFELAFKMNYLLSTQSNLSFCPADLMKKVVINFLRKHQYFLPFEIETLEENFPIQKL